MRSFFECSSLYRVRKVEMLTLERMLVVTLFLQGRLSVAVRRSECETYLAERAGTGACPYRHDVFLIMARFWDTLALHEFLIAGIVC
jgi:hypothetical protein